jgi:hypothetical protein
MKDDLRYRTGLRLLTRKAKHLVTKTGLIAEVAENRPFFSVD